MLGNLRIKLEYQDDEPTPPNTFPDFDWAREHREQLREQYNEGVVLVFEQQVIGYGKSIDEAVSDATSKLPQQIEQQITPIIFFLGSGLRLRRIRRNSPTADS